MNRTSLKQLTTFRVAASCKGIVSINSVFDLYKFLTTNDDSFRILGGGSNVLIAEDVDAMILVNQIKGIEIIEEDDEALLVKVGGGEQWHNFVLWSVSHQLGGVENLALIPGKVGAAPIQNIGAYGVEQSDSFHSLVALDMKEGINKVFYKDDCQFGYRDSVFKHTERSQYFITHVVYKLSKNPQINTSYGAISEKLAANGIQDPTVKDICDVVSAIRGSKLPDPAVIHNAGSFFKNPIIDRASFEALQAKYPDIKYYQVGDQYKIPAAWLIESAGLKGYRVGDAGIYENHALVLVNHGDASGSEVLDIAHHVRDVVAETYGITLTPEVNVW